MSFQRVFGLGFAVFFASACGDHDLHKQAPLNATTETGPTGDCAVVVRSYDGGSQTHVAECSDIEYATSPPVSGAHYPTWAAYQTYDFPVPLGFLVHDLEHGAVVIFYDCSDGCKDEVAEVQAFIDTLPDDPRCSPDVRVQVVLVPRPGLGSRWAASAWGRSLNADCFDPELFREFYEASHGRGPEDLCNQGVAFTKDPCQ